MSSFIGQISNSNDWIPIVSGINRDSGIYIGEISKPSTSAPKRSYSFFDYNPISISQFSLFTDRSTNISIGNKYYITQQKKTEETEETEDEKAKRQRQNTALVAFGIFTGATALGCYYYNRYNKAKESFYAFSDIKTSISNWVNLSNQSIEYDIYSLVSKHLELDQRQKNIFQEIFIELALVVAASTAVIVGFLLTSDVVISAGVVGIGLGSLAFIFSSIRNFISVQDKNNNSHQQLYALSNDIISRLSLNPRNDLGGKMEAEIVDISKVPQPDIFFISGAQIEPSAPPM